MPVKIWLLHFNGDTSVITKSQHHHLEPLFRFLYLGGNNIGVEGSKVIADFIPKAKSLQHLYLGKARGAVETKPDLLFRLITEKLLSVSESAQNGYNTDNMHNI